MTRYSSGTARPASQALRVSATIALAVLRMHQLQVLGPARTRPSLHADAARTARGPSAAGRSSRPIPSTTGPPHRPPGAVSRCLRASATAAARSSVMSRAVPVAPTISPRASRSGTALNDRSTQRAIAPPVPGLVPEHGLARHHAREHRHVALAQLRHRQLVHGRADQVRRLAAVDAPHRRRIEVGPAALQVDRPDQVVRGLDQAAVQRLAAPQRQLRGVALRGVREHHDRRLLRRFGVDRARQRAAPEPRAVLARERAVALEDAAVAQLLVHAARAAPGLVRGIEHARRTARELPRRVAQHALQARIAAHDHAVLDERDADRQHLEHQVLLVQHRLVGGLRLLGRPRCR